jgi:GNAT superfamily N-acetyltransferase
MAWLDRFRRVSDQDPWARARDSFDSLLKYGPETHQIEHVPVDFLARMLEYQRAPGAGHAEADPGYWNTLKEHMAQHGLMSPVSLRYDPDTGYGYVDEGNHRVGIAQELGWEHVPTRVHQGRVDPARHPHAQKLTEPGSHLDPRGYFPSSCKPSYIGVPVKADGSEHTGSASPIDTDMYHVAPRAVAGDIEANGLRPRVDGEPGTMPEFPVIPGVVYAYPNLANAQRFADALDRDNVIYRVKGIPDHRLVPDHEELDDALNEHLNYSAPGDRSLRDALHAITVDGMPLTSWWKARVPRHDHGGQRSVAAVGELPEAARAQAGSVLRQFGQRVAISGPIEPRHLERLEEDPERYGSRMSADDDAFGGWTNWHTMTVAEALENNYYDGIYEGVNKLVERGATAQQLADYALKRFISKFNREQLRDAQDWNGTPEDERPQDPSYEALPDEAKDLVNGIVGPPDRGDYTPDLIDPELVNWQEILDSFKATADEGAEYDRTIKNFQSQGLGWVTNHDEDTNKMRDAIMRFHGAIPEEEHGGTYSEYRDHPQNPRNIRVPISLDEVKSGKWDNYPEDFISSDTRHLLWKLNRMRLREEYQREHPDFPWHEMDPEEREDRLDKLVGWHMPMERKDKRWTADELARDPEARSLVENDPEHAQRLQQAMNQPLDEFTWKTIHHIRNGNAAPEHATMMQQALTQRGYAPQDIQRMMTQQFHINPATGRPERIQPLPEPEPKPEDPLLDKPGDFTLPPEWTARRRAYTSRVAKITPRFTTQGGDSFGDEYHGRYVALHPETGEYLGHVDYGQHSLAGYPAYHIKHIEVDPKWRRHGIATSLLNHMAEQEPEAKFDPGMLTEDGAGLHAPLKENFPDRFVPPPCEGCGSSYGHYQGCPIVAKDMEDGDHNYWSPGERVQGPAGQQATVGEWNQGGLDIHHDDGTVEQLPWEDPAGYRRVSASENPDFERMDPRSLNITDPSLHGQVHGDRFEFEHTDTKRDWGSDRYQYQVRPRGFPAHVDHEAYGRTRRFYYDPELTEPGPGEFRPEFTLREGTGWAHANGFRDDVTRDPNLLYRGISKEEWDAIHQTGQIESNREYNMGEDGTLYSTDPGQAQNYATGFAPRQYVPTYTHPGYVVAIPRPADAHPHPNMGADTTEIVVPSAVPASAIQHAWEFRPYAMTEGHQDIGSDTGGKTWRGMGSASPSGYTAYRPVTVNRRSVESGIVEAMAVTRTQQLANASAHEAQFGADRSDIVHTLDDGWTVRKLRTLNDQDREGKLMSNCLDFDSPDHSSRDWDDAPEGHATWRDWLEANRATEMDDHKYSLRDPDNLPHVTFQYNPGYLYDPAGRHNSTVKPEYWDRIRQWLSTQDKPTKVDWVSDDGIPEEWHNPIEPRQAKSGHTLTWRRGTYGRGLVAPEGRVITWPEDDCTTHNQMLMGLGVNHSDTSKWVQFRIDKDGSVFLSRGPYDPEHMATYLPSVDKKLNVTAWQGKPYEKTADVGSNYPPQITEHLDDNLRHVLWVIHQPENRPALLNLYRQFEETRNTSRHLGYDLYVTIYKTLGDQFPKDFDWIQTDWSVLARCFLHDLMPKFDSGGDSAGGGNSMVWRPGDEKPEYDAESGWTEGDHDNFFQRPEQPFDDENEEPFNIGDWMHYSLIDNEPGHPKGSIFGPLRIGDINDQRQQFRVIHPNGEPFGGQPNDGWYDVIEGAMFRKHTPETLAWAQQGQQPQEPPRQANILDPVQETLDSAVFLQPGTHKPRLKPQLREWLLDTIYNILEQGGYEGAERWAKLFLTGSLTTYQYADHSDCDISIFVDHHAFPEWSRAEMIGLMVEHCDGLNLPGTPHPLQVFVVAKGIEPSDLYRPGLRSGYDLLKDEWVVAPERSRAHNVEGEDPEGYATGLMAADKMERLVRYEPDKAITYYQQLHRKRARDQADGKGDYAQSNLIYKMLDNRGLFDRLRELGVKIASPVRYDGPHLQPHAGLELYRGEARPAGDLHQLLDQSGVGMHWTTIAGSVVHPQLIDLPGGPEGGQNVVWHATLEDPSHAVPRSHNMWNGKHRSMAWENEVRLFPHSQLKINGAYVWRGGDNRHLHDRDPWTDDALELRENGLSRDQIVQIINEYMGAGRYDEPKDGYWRQWSKEQLPRWEPEQQFKFHDAGTLKPKHGEGIIMPVGPYLGAEEQDPRWEYVPLDRHAEVRHRPLADGPGGIDYGYLDERLKRGSTD